MSNMDRIRRYKDNRGIMANLRCILVESKKHRAWPILSRLGIRIDKGPLSFISGLYATHPEESHTGNFGKTCKEIEEKRGELRGDKNTPTELRFQHLLASEYGKELNNRVLRMTLWAKSLGIPINYERLETDLRFWGDGTRTAWASSFWSFNKGDT